MTEEFFNRIELQQAHIESSLPVSIKKSIWGSTVELDNMTRLNKISGEGSVHYHTLRSEEYILLDGKMLVLRGELFAGNPEKTISSLKETIMHPGDKITIAQNIVHVAINTSLKGPSTFLEITKGIYEEQDVHRVYDKTGRDISLANTWGSRGYPSGLSAQDLMKEIIFKKKAKDMVWPYTEEGAKVVTKPWGKEVWLNYREGEEVGDKEKKYVFKKIYVNAGTRMSFQHHERKQEVNFLIAGKVEAWLENEQGEIEKKIVGAGSIWEIFPPKKHRMVALEDSVLLECSTPEVDDVVRHQDDAGRGDGRITTEHSK